VFSSRRSLGPLPGARTVIVGAAALTFLSACSAAESPEPVEPAATVAETVTTAPTAQATTTVPAPSTTIAVSASEVSLPAGFPIVFPPGGEVTATTEGIEPASGGDDQLVTRIDVTYEGDRLEEFAVFYGMWIVENGNLILDTGADEDGIYFYFLGFLPPDNDSFGVTVTTTGDATLVQTTWGRPPG
jgi:hypothetical protein